MSLISIANINEESKSINISEKTAMKREIAYSIYESLEYVKNNLGENNIKLQMEMMKSFIR